MPTRWSYQLSVSLIQGGISAEVTDRTDVINATIGMFLTGFMVLGIYYSNSWLTGYLPINS